jgi:membrane-bound inhibitor of C-type lysozyme
MSLAFFILVFTIVFGCSGKAFKPGITYRCDGGKIFVVEVYEKIDMAFLKVEEKRTFYLPRVPSASGAKYSEGNVTLRIEGDKASVEIDGQTEFKNCSVKPK